MNQREIKFRNCSHIDKKCYEPFTIKDMFLHAKGGSIIAEDNELCQFTGLKDKNGKEIWEGDLLISNKGAKPFKVIFEDGSFDGKDENSKGWIDLRIFELDKKRKTIWEVIGNIYENPEL
jgi:uncharacterized phage protein (TIGR01671 family)